MAVAPIFSKDVVFAKHMQQSPHTSHVRPLPPLRLSEATRVDISLRNFLCLSVLESGLATAFHLGNIVRSAFVLAYLNRFGYAVLTAKELRRAERSFGRATERFHRDMNWELDHDELRSAREVVSAFDLSLDRIPVSVLALAHRHAQANFGAPLEQRLSISSLADHSMVSHSAPLPTAAG